MRNFTYSQAVAETQAYITITIDLEEPIELSDFASLFASLAKQFDDYLAATHPDLSGEGRIFIKEVRHGSIVADLVPLMLALVDVMDKTLIVKQFSEWVAARVGSYVEGRRLLLAIQRHERDDLRFAQAAAARLPRLHCAVRERR